MEKVNNYIRKNIIFIVSFFILLQPLIDVIIGLCSSNMVLAFIASLIRIFVLGFFIYYLIFINNSKSKKKVICLLSIIFAYLLFYFVHMNYSFNEIKLALKTFYFPTLFPILFLIKEEEGKFIDTKYLLISLFTYSSIIIFGFITNTAFQSYQIVKEGTSGYFYAANEISGIIAILLPFVFEYVFKRIDYKKVLYLLTIILSIFIMGTKTPIISLIICSIYYIIKSINKNNYIKVTITSLVVIIILFVILPITPIYKNTLIHASFLKLNSIKQLIEEPSLLDHFILGSRLKFLNENTEIYMNSDIDDKLLGIGYTENIKLSEMDLNDIFYRQGIIGFIIYFVSIFYILFINGGKINTKYLLSVLLILLTATIVGHIITAPAVSTFSAYIMCLFKKERSV